MESLATAVRELLDCPELNHDQLTDETRRDIQRVTQVLDHSENDVAVIAQSVDDLHGTVTYLGENVEMMRTALEALVGEVASLKKTLPKTKEKSPTLF